MSRRSEVVETASNAHHVRRLTAALLLIAGEGLKLNRTLETLHTIILFRKFYFYTVLSVDNPSNLAKLDWYCVILLFYIMQQSNEIV